MIFGLAALECGEILAGLSSGLGIDVTRHGGDGRASRKLHESASEGRFANLELAHDRELHGSGFVLTHNRVGAHAHDLLTGGRIDVEAHCALASELDGRIFAKVVAREL